MFAKFKPGDRIRGKVTRRTGTFVDYMRLPSGRKSERAHIVRWDGKNGHSIAFRIERYNGDQT